jgi:hypothetical protein
LLERQNTKQRAGAMEEWVEWTCWHVDLSLSHSTPFFSCHFLFQGVRWLMWDKCCSPLGIQTSQQHTEYWQNHILLPAPTEMASLLRVPRKLCSIMIFLRVIYYIGTTGHLRFYYIQSRGTTGYKSNHHYDQEYDFHETEPKQRRRKRGRRSGLLVRLCRRAHRAPLPSILLANVQSLDYKVDEIRARVAFQRDITDYNVLCFTETWLTRDTLLESVQSAGIFTHRTDRNKHFFLVR